MQGSWERNTRQNLKAGPDGGHGGMLPTVLLPVSCSVCFIYHSGPPVQGWDHPQWTWPSHINLQSRKFTKGLFTGLAGGEAILLIEVPSFKMTLDGVKFTKANQFKDERKEKAPENKSVK